MVTPCAGVSRRGLLSGLLVALIVWLAAGADLVAYDLSSCSDCHADICETFHESGHGRYLISPSNESVNVCESCHGDGKAHIESGDAAQIINPGKTDLFSSSETCLSCHKGPSFDDWAHSSHKLSDVGCSSCHHLHGSEATASRPQGEDLCYGCHIEVRMAASMPSHHPIAEGKISCIDCHNPHGSSSLMAGTGGDRELCFGCHADKEGPFIYEHAPVNEDCLICHAPHGTVADNLLKQTEPTLCLSCHAMHFHATAEGVDGEFTVPLDPSRNGVSTSDGWKTAMLTKCTQCHTVIHGTDNPSQTISTGGNALTR